MKVRSILFLVVLAASLIVACQPVIKVVQATPPAPAFKVAFLLAESPEDHGWNAAHYRGISNLKSLGKVVNENHLSFTIQLSEGGLLQVQVIEKVGYNPADIKRVAREAVLSGAQMVFGTWWDSKDAMAELAEEYPDVLFEHCSGYPVIQSNGKNLSTYFIRQEQGDYIAGFVAGKLGYEKVGAVGTHMIPEPVRAMNGFFLGMKHGLNESEKNADPSEAEMRIVWIFSWLDQQKEIFAAEGLMGEGYKVIRQLADTPYSSKATCEQEGTVAFGYGTDVSTYAPCAIVTNEWDWGQYYRERVEAAMNGSWVAHDWWGGFESGSIKMVGWNATVSQEIRVDAEALVQKIASGEFNPFCGPISGRGLNPGGEEVTVEVPKGKCLSDMDQLTMQWFVNGVLSELPAPSNQELQLVDAK